MLFSTFVLSIRSNLQIVRRQIIWAFGCHDAENEEPQERSYPMDQVRTVGLDIAKTRMRRAETMRIGCRLLYGLAPV